MHFIGIDLGTSTISAVAYDFSTKKIDTVTRQNDAALLSSATWEKIQSPDRICEQALHLIRDFTARYPDIRGIGLAGQMHGILYVDAAGNAASPLYTWQDGRANQPFKGTQSCVDYLSEKTGYAPAAGFGLATHFYNSVNRLVPATAVKLCTIMDYLVMKLCKRKTPLTDYTNGASLGFFDLAHATFDLPALSGLIDPSLLPDVAASATLAGYYGRIPVYSAIGDNQASLLGSAADMNHSIHLTVGTSSQISVYSEDFIEVPTLDTRPFPGGGYILVGAALCGGQSLAILKAFFEDTLRFFIGDKADGIDIYNAISTFSPPPALPPDLPVVETFFDGARTEPSRRGAITNISSSNLTTPNLIHGFIRGICRELFDFYDLIPDRIKAGKSVLIGSGNGIKKNLLLCRAIEEQFNCRMTLSSCHEEAAFGACICSIVGGGYVKNFLDFSSL